MAYQLENALDQWNEGERRVAGDPALDRPIRAVLAELRKRLGGVFEVMELAELYGTDVDWAFDVAQQESAAADASWVVAAAFALYAREASDYAGGRRHFVASSD